ncbi:MAG TPA: PQQ-binding-like beta-propeller repeat protein, partial [Blastocatellia bacterium]|nr:PQQ-binding-like beta-propeller repeat protein [Blastocatellia bacterium]
SGRVEWEAKDLGLTPEMILANGVLYVRTGGRFTRLKDGEAAERGPYGVSAIDARTGKTLWRYKGADKGITNIAIPDASTVLIADRDDLIWIDAQTGKARKKASHRVKDAEFVLLNEQGDAVIGGSNEIAAFETSEGRNLWRARHDPPGRGILRTILAISLRAASLYFRFGGLALTAVRGVRIAHAATSLRWSGLARAAGPNLSSLAANSAQEYVSSRFSPIGVASRINRLSNGIANARNIKIPRPSIDVEERLVDRIDPARQMDRLSRFLWHRRQLASLRGQWMYFYTDLKREGGRGLAGVNVNTGSADREIRLNELDDRFITDEATGLLFTSNGNRLSAFPAR